MSSPPKNELAVGLPKLASRVLAAKMTRPLIGMGSPVEVLRPSASILMVTPQAGFRDMIKTSAEANRIRLGLIGFLFMVTQSFD